MKKKVEKNNDEWYNDFALPSGWAEEQNLYFLSSLFYEDAGSHLVQAVSVFSLMVSSGMADLDKICQDGPTWRDIDSFERLWSVAAKGSFEDGNHYGTPAREAYPVIVFCYHAMRYGANKELEKIKEKWTEEHPEMC